jgi:phage-related protein
MVTMKPLNFVGPSLDDLRNWRIIYVAKLRDAVYVLHAFQKKTRKTSRHDIDLAVQRYRQIGGNL